MIIIRKPMFFLQHIFLGKRKDINKKQKQSIRSIFVLILSKTNQLIMIGRLHHPSMAKFVKKGSPTHDSRKKMWLTHLSIECFTNMQPSICFSTMSIIMILSDKVVLFV